MEDSKPPACPSSRLAHYGWIETRGEHHLLEVRLTQAGLNKMRSKI
jgi:hypothetical protein